MVLYNAERAELVAQLRKHSVEEKERRKAVLKQRNLTKSRLYNPEDVAMILEDAKLSVGDARVSDKTLVERMAFDYEPDFLQLQENAAKASARAAVVTELRVNKGQTEEQRDLRREKLMRKREVREAAQSAAATAAKGRKPPSVALADLVQSGKVSHVKLPCLPASANPEDVAMVIEDLALAAAVPKVARTDLTMDYEPDFLEATTSGYNKRPALVQRLRKISLAEKQRRKAILVKRYELRMNGGVAPAEPQELATEESKLSKANVKGLSAVGPSLMSMSTMAPNSASMSSLGDVVPQEPASDKSSVTGSLVMGEVEDDDFSDYTVSSKSSNRNSRVSVQELSRDDSKTLAYPGLAGDNFSATTGVAVLEEFRKQQCVECNDFSASQMYNYDSTVYGAALPEKSAGTANQEGYNGYYSPYGGPKALNEPLREGNTFEDYDYPRTPRTLKEFFFPHLEFRFT